MGGHFYHTAERPAQRPAATYAGQQIARHRGEPLRWLRHHGKRITKVGRRDMDRLVAYDWPGNVRELQNVIERCVVLSLGEVLQLHDPTRNGSTLGSLTKPLPGTDDLAEVERAHIERVLQRCGWRVKGPGNAAERLGLNPSTLRGRMRKLGIQRPGVGAPA